jgi:hypothetical protein
MAPKGPGGTDDLVAQIRKHQREREGTYRERALKMYPHICGRCAREFSGKRLKELTVHHRDHNHDNNPPDGSNWELLCIYCHENEHARNAVADAYAEEALSGGIKKPELSHQPFAALADLLKKK